MVVNAEPTAQNDLEAEVTRSISPHIPVINKSDRKDGTFERAYVTFDAENDLYICPGSNELKQYRRAYKTLGSGANKDDSIRYPARTSDRDGCALKDCGTPKEPQRKVTRSIYETPCDVAQLKTELFSRISPKPSLTPDVFNNGFQIRSRHPFPMPPHGNAGFSKYPDG